MNIKKIIKDLVPLKLDGYRFVVTRNRRAYSNESFFNVLIRSKAVVPSIGKKGYARYVDQMNTIFRSMTIDYSSKYIYPYDHWIFRIQPKGVRSIGSITVDYSTVLELNLNDVKKKLKNQQSGFYRAEVEMIESLEILINKIINGLKKEDTSRSQILVTYFQRLLACKPESLDEALQKILFFNALFWQAGHWHNGLGRLDLILQPYYEKDIQNGKITREAAKGLIREFCLTLAKDMRTKSIVLIGDTGQYIMLGGVDSKGNTVQNDITDLFIEVVTELKIPDPKLILRVNEQTSHNVWMKSVECLLTGCGSPLFMNEKLIMKGMIEFGYSKDDVWNVGTSACWEPLIIGKSLDQNNSLANVPVITCLNDVLVSGTFFNSFEDLMTSLKEKIKLQVLSYIHEVNNDCSLLYSLFFSDCLQKGKDFSHGGATYAYNGVQIVSFPNLINALLNIKRYVYEERLIYLDDVTRAISSNFKDCDDLLALIASNDLKYGADNSQVVDLTNDLINFISQVVSTKTMGGQKLKLGFSSSAFVTASGSVSATFDGRRNGEPFAVHISPTSSKIDIQEILNFAGQLNYSDNLMNGNVVDFIIPVAFAKEKDKLIAIIRNALINKVYELQLNVLDLNTLKDAKAHPENYPNLVVRVWGFSAYFNDLPEVYKDNLIQRAEKYAC